MLKKLWRRWNELLHGDRLDREAQDEVAYHVELATAEKVRAGIDAVEARRQVRLELGDPEETRERLREGRAGFWLDALLKDVQYALRTLRKNPGFATVVITTLALGIGANTLVFSIVNAVMLKELPLDHPGRIVFVQPNAAGYVTHSFPNYRDLRDRNVTFDGLIGYRMSPMEVEFDGAPARAWGYLATGNYFDVLGVQPALGRFFHQADDLQPGAAPFAVLSHDFWRARFSSDPSVAGTIVRINRLPYTVLGVAPPGFVGTELFYRPQIWVPMMMQAQIEVGNPWLERRRTSNVWIAGRLKTGVSPSQAASNLNAIATSLAREYPDANEGLILKLTKPGLAGDALRAPAQAFTLGVLGLAALVLLTACANLASTLGARGADRAREIAVRLSLGASRGRVVRQLLTETLLLAIVGGAAGYVVAYAASAALAQSRLPIDLPVQLDIHTDIRVLLFSCAASALAGLIFGLAPARHAARIDANTALKTVDGAIVGNRRWALRDVLVAVQVAFCFVLVAACLLSLRGLQQALMLQLGFEPQGVSTVGFELGLAGYGRDRGASFQQRALEAVRRLPGVLSVAYANTLPLTLDQSISSVYREEETDRRTPAARAATFAVSPGFFETLRIGLRSGRYIDDQDTLAARRVAVVNETFARDVLGGNNPVGRRFRFGPGGPLVEVVGVVGNGKYRTLTENPQPAVFTPSPQTYNSTTTLLVRASVPPNVMVAQMREALSALDPALPLYSAESLEQMLRLALFPNRAAATALSAFGLLAVVLAATGIHGVVAYAVARRRREIGIRVAIGATRIDVLRLVFGRIAALVGAGTMVGVVLAIMIGPLLTQVVYQASPREPLVFVAVGLIVALVGLVACWAPAARSLGIEPIIALRSE